MFPACRWSSVHRHRRGALVSRLIREFFPQPAACVIGRRETFWLRGSPYLATVLRRWKSPFVSVDNITVSADIYR